MFTMFTIAAFLCALVSASASEALAENQDNGRDGHGKVMPIFQVIKFKNDLCGATQGRNGTCYTETECKDRGGTNTGACAEGFGVCCSFVLSCGGSTSDNGSYLVQAATTSISGCIYTVCPMDSRVGRIRYDFTTMVLQNTLTGTITAVGTGSPTVAIAGGAGHCIKDGFSITAPSYQSSPIICGTNTGAHMVLDSDGVSCQTVNIYTDTSTASRSWDIYITQHLHGSQTESAAGPPGCLQYFTGKTGVLQSFNFPGSPYDLSATDVMHLNNQYYTICIRREKGITGICYSPIGTASITAPTMGSYGIGISAAAAIGNSQIGTSCMTDYLELNGASLIATFPLATVITQTLYRVCGRTFNTSASQTAHVTICTFSRPFTVRVNFDNNEFLDILQSGIADMAILVETNGTPSGTLGFALLYTQS